MIRDTMKSSTCGSTLARGVAGAVVVLSMTACSVAPTYQRPDITFPAAFKELSELTVDPVRPADSEQSGDGPFTWKIAAPAEYEDRGQWWLMFEDTTLNALESQATDANQDLKAAAARVQQSRALLRHSQADLFPTVGAGFGPTRQRLSPASQALPSDAAVSPQTLWRAQATASYEVDLFGRVSASVDAARADQGRSEALLRSVHLALQADVAQNYFQLREFDARLDLYRQTVTLREGSLKLLERRFDEGDIGELDVFRARGELGSARADAIGIARQRALAEHRLAILLGRPPADFSLPGTALAPVRLRVPVGLPSSLLERRPDIAAAEMTMAAANARIGLAHSAFFPKLDITGAFGYESATLGDLFHWSSRAFLLGPLAGTALTLPIFDGGRRQANLANARARYEEDVALYRQQVLVAFQEVEDSLANLRWLDEQTREQANVVSASRQSDALSRRQYQEGQISYLEVIDAQRQVLQSQLQASQLAGAYAVSTVSLIRSLGGTWGGERTKVAKTRGNDSQP